MSLSLIAPRFLLENFCLDEHVRYIVTIYPVVIVWLTGILDNASSLESHIFVFTGTVWHLDWGKLAHCIFFHLLLHDYFNFWELFTNYMISSSLFSCDPGYFLHCVCGTYCPGHVEALQTTTLQWQWTQYPVTSRNFLNTKQCLSSNIRLGLCLGLFCFFVFLSW